MSIKFMRLFSLMLIAFLIFLPKMASAHPLGNFTINRYSRLELGAEQIHLVYVVDMAEIPAHQERAKIDSDGDGTVSDAEQESYLAERLNQLQRNLHLTINGTTPPWTLVEQSIEFPEGQAGLRTQRIVARFEAPLSDQALSWQAEYRDDNFQGRLGWQEVIVQVKDGIELFNSSVPMEDLSQELRVYPTDLLQSPLAVNQADFQFEKMVGQSHANSAIQTSTAGSDVAVQNAIAATNNSMSSEPFADLLKTPILGPISILFALLAAFGWGAAHALSPGHGKTIVGAYLVGSRGTVRHALFLGLTTTITHTAGVFALGLITLFASRFILPEELFPWLSLVSGLLVLCIGFSMGRQWLKMFLARQSHHHGGHVHHHHDDHHNLHHNHHADHGHYHPHGHGHTHDGEEGHSHLPPGTDGSPITWRSLLALGVSGGLLPCPSALVVMLGAIALNRIGFGLLLIVAFSLGLAGVLTGVGIVLVHAGKLFERVPESGRLLQLMPVASALFITVLGLGITVQAVVGIL